MAYGNTKNRNRSPYDYYPTPYWVTRALLEREKFEGIIHEPAYGGGHIGKVLTEFGYAFSHSDINTHDGVDFLKDDERRVNIITNPPYSLAKEFVEHSLDVCSGKIAMLMPLYFMTTESRRPLLQSGYMHKAYVITKRLNIDVANRTVASQFNHVWYVFGKDKRDTTMYFI